MKKGLYIVFCLVTSFFIISCTSSPITGRSQMKFVSDQAMATKYAGEYTEMISSFRQQGALANDTSNGKLVQKVGNNISGAVETYLKSQGQEKKISYLKWEFNLINSDIPNAFAMPGGKIAFYTGIMPFAKNEAGIAAIMGHEIGHVIAGHHAEGESTRQTASAILIGKQVVDVVTGGRTSVVDNTLVETGLTMGILKFNRTQEYEADKLGMIFMAMSGYNPEESIRLWERMGAGESKSSSDIFSTHPNSEKRIKAMQDFLPEAMKYYKK